MTLPFLPIGPPPRPQPGMTMVNPWSQRRWSWEMAAPGAALPGTGLAQAPGDDAKKALFRAKLVGLGFGLGAGVLLTWIVMRNKGARA